MSNGQDADLLTEAIAWHLRLRDGDEEDWAAFTCWLEDDPEHSDAFDEVAEADDAISADLFRPPAIPPSPIVSLDERRRGRMRGAQIAVAAIAAALVLALVSLPMLTGRADRYEIATAGGQQRVIALADGSSAHLNGGTRLIVDRGEPRNVELVSGEATFTVRHDGLHPFMVIAGDHRVQDIGTTFNLIRDGDDLTVEVIEGAVVYDARSANMHLSAGQALSLSGESGARLTRTDPQAIAGWRHGRLSYSGAPLSRVTRDLSRTLGISVTLSPELSRLTFTGIIRIRSDPATAVNDLALAAGLLARRSNSGWIIEPVPRAVH